MPSLDPDLLHRLDGHLRHPPCRRPVLGGDPDEEDEDDFDEDEDDEEEDDEDEDDEDDDDLDEEDDEEA
jgi:hypothetical protein